jgi:hypothetical protein
LFDANVSGFFIFMKEGEKQEKAQVRGWQNKNKNEIHG